MDVPDDWSPRGGRAGTPDDLRSLDDGHNGAAGPRPTGRPAVRSIQLEPRVEDLRRRPRLEAPGFVGWLVPPVALLAIAAGILLVRTQPTHLFPWIFGAMVLGAVGWVIVSALSPAKPDRRCPQCGAESLERLRADATRGIRCATCLWVDETASSFFFAEDELPALEDVVLRERRLPFDRRPGNL